MTEQKLTPATPEALADSLSFALRFEGRKSKHDSDKLSADIVAQRLVRYLDKAGYVVMKKPPWGALSGGPRVWSGVTSGYPRGVCPIGLTPMANPSPNHAFAAASSRTFPSDKVALMNCLLGSPKKSLSAARKSSSVV
jgi:hypothetical protein